MPMGSDAQTCDFELDEQEDCNFFDWLDEAIPGVPVTTDNAAQKADSLFLVDFKEEQDTISSDAVNDYVKSLENLRKNGGTTKETVESFKRAAKALQELDQKALQQELDKGARDPKVHSIHVLMHLKELLQTSGFKVIACQPEVERGSTVLKNEKTETYIEMQFSREKGKEGADVKITRNKAG